MTIRDRDGMLLWRIRVSPRQRELDVHGAAVLRDIHELGLTHVQRVASSRLFLVQGRMSREAVTKTARDLLAEHRRSGFRMVDGWPANEDDPERRGDDDPDRDDTGGE